MLIYTDVFRSLYYKIKQKNISIIQYLDGTLIRALLASNSPILAWQEEWTCLAQVDKAVTCIINVLAFSSKATVANFLLSISSTLWLVSRAFTVEYLFFLSSFYVNRMFILEKVRKDISKIISILVLAKQKVFSKNQIF